MNHSEDQDPAWDLLNQARNIDVSPAFTRNVLREARKLGPQPEPGVLSWFSFCWGAAIAGAAALVIGGFLFLQSANLDGAAADSVVEEEAGPRYEEEITIEEFTAELEELAYMSELFDVADPSLLPDEDLAALLF